MQKTEASPKKKSYFKRYKKNRDRMEAQKLSRKILAEAKKIAEIEIQKMAMEVLSEAMVIARWEKKPFYIS